MSNKVLDFQQYVPGNIIRSFICNMKRPSVKQSMNVNDLADEPTLADGPHPLSIKHGSPEDHYTKSFS